MVEIDDRVPAFLGRLLDDEGDPIGTCFQVKPGVLVTAWHVLKELDRGEVGAGVRLDPLQGGSPRDARVERIDLSHDLAVVVTDKPLANCVAGLTATDEVPQATPVTVTGVVIMDDPGHSYRHLDTSGHWAGGTTRDDGIRLGRMVVEALMRGMSGAPALSGHFVVGVVTARYNSADEWARNSVWVIRTEDLTPLLAGLDGISVPKVDSAQAAMSQAAGAQIEKALTAGARELPAMSGDGVFVVGLDIKPGVYRTAGPVSGRKGYYALLSSTNTHDIINNNNIAGRATITVGPEVRAVSVSGCQPWFWQGTDLDSAIDGVRQSKGDNVLGGDGVFVVGLDIKPGVYRTAGPVSGRKGYYALLSSTNTHDIINNNNIAGRATITVGPEVRAVNVSGCQPWFWQGTDLDSAIDGVRREAHSEEVLGSIMGGDGVFVVGLDIKPGVYRTAGPVSGRKGYYALLSSTNTHDIINNNNIAGRATITVGPEVRAVSVSGCQPWFWQGTDLDSAIAAGRNL